MLKVNSIVNSIFDSITWLLFDTESNSVWLVDCGDVDSILKKVGDKKIEGVLLTHAHFDHIYGLPKLIGLFSDCKIYTNEIGRETLADVKLNMSYYHEMPLKVEGPQVVVCGEGDEISLFHHIKACVYETPGHHPSCITYLVSDYLFTGDSFIPNIKVVTNLPKGNKSQAQESLVMIRKLGEGKTICPGHNYLIKRMNKRIVSLSVEGEETLLSVIHKMDSTTHRLLIVMVDGRYRGLVSIGDIQRAIIKGIALDSPVELILRQKITVASVHDDKNAIKEVMREKMIEYMPVIDDDGNVADIIFWKDLFEGEMTGNRAKIDLPVVIMAGGKGTRLKPITNVIPKPLVPVGDKTILEVIMDQFESIGCHKFYMSVNYKADMMKYYLSQLNHKYDIEFFMEDKPLGTIGSVSLLKGKINTPFFVSNCDSINEQDYRDVYDYHISNHNDMTIVTMVKSFKIPYGVIETGEDGLMTALKEKPEQTYQVNTGVYILNPELIDEIPEGEFFHITHLMEKVQARGGRVGCFPVSEKSWRDMGEWKEYLKMINVL